MSDTDSRVSTTGHQVQLYNTIRWITYMPCDNIYNHKEGC